MQETRKFDVSLHGLAHFQICWMLPSTCFLLPCNIMRKNNNTNNRYAVAQQPQIASKARGASHGAQAGGGLSVTLLVQSF